LRTVLNNTRCTPCLLILLLLLTTSQSVFSTGKYDDIFALQGYERSATLEAIYNSVKYPSADFEEIRELVKKKGSASDKLQFRFREAFHKTDFQPTNRYTKLKGLLQQTAAEAKKLGDHYLQALMYYYISEDARDEGLPNVSFENKLYCLDELKKDKTGKYFEQSWFLHDIASEYYRFKDYTQAATLSKAAFGLNGRFQPGTPDWFLILSSNLAGVAYLKGEQFDSASLWLNRTYHLAEAANKKNWTGISLGNLGDLSYSQKRYTAAIPYYQKAIAQCTATGLWDNVAPFSISLADCYIQTGNLVPVEELLQKANDAIKKQYDVNRHYINYYTNHINYYTALITFLKKTNRIHLTDRYADSLAKYKLKEEETYNLDKKILSEVQLAYRNKSLENKVTLQQLQQTKWILYSLTGAGLALLAIAILLYKRRNLQQKLKQEHLEHKRMMAEEELHIALTEIKDFTILVQQKNELIQQFSEQVELLKQQSIIIPDERLQQIEQIKQSVILTDDDWSRFKQSFEKAHPGYLTRLKEKFPGLTQAETRYCLLTKLELSTKEMTAMLGVTPEALRHIRFRLRRKLQDSGDDIHSLILMV
jgi:hypothetical protein